MNRLIDAACMTIAHTIDATLAAADRSRILGPVWDRLLDKAADRIDVGGQWARLTDDEDRS